MEQPTAAMLVIGDEILSGRTRDSNAHFLAKALTAHGVELKQIRVVGDEAGRITADVRALSRDVDYLFTSGGIGPTHDDITAESVAAAFDVPIGIREDARAILAEHYAARNQELNAARLRMARIPEAAELIPNPITAAPGFRLANTFVLAGVPKIFEAMLANVLPSLAGGKPTLSQTLRMTRGEGDIAELLATLVPQHPNVTIGSYPYTENGVFGTNIVVRGQEANAVETAIHALRDLDQESAQ